MSHHSYEPNRADPVVGIRTLDGARNRGGVPWQGLKRNKTSWLLLDRHLRSIWDGDLATYQATTAPEVTFFEWYISTQRIDGLGLPFARDRGHRPRV